MSETHVRVVCRFRPIDKREALEGTKRSKSTKATKSDGTCVTLEHQINTIKVNIKNKKENALQFVVDEILDQNSSQDETFQVVAEPTVRDILRGYNGTIFAYGQTGSGKTHSMYGPPEGAFNAQQSGIVPRAISMLFQSLEDHDSILQFTIKVSFVEIYLERLVDLLNVDGQSTQSKSTSKKKKKGKTKKTPHKSGKQKQAEKDANKLRIRTLPNGSTIIQNLYEEECANLMDVLALIQKASQNRTTSATSMNQTSSRSHLLFMVGIEQKMQDGSTRLSKLNFADLAGSEKVKKTEASGTRLEEAKMINKSLSQLGIVIRALSEKKSFISYRDSALTHVLKDSLGGNTKTTLLCTCSPHMFNRDETISTLRFATRTKLITNTVFKNTVLSPQQMAKLIKNLKTEIVDLRQKLQDKVISSIDAADDSKDADFAMEKSATQLDPAVQKQMIDDLKNYKDENLRLQQDQLLSKGREEDLQKLVAQLRSEIEDWKEKHSNALLQSETLSNELDEARQANTDKDALIAELQNKLTDLNAQLLASADAKQKQNMQLEFLSTIYQSKLKKVESEQQEMEHQKSLIQAQLAKNRAALEGLQSEMGDLIDSKVASKIQGLESESKFYEEQETRIDAVLKMFEEEKGLLTTSENTLSAQLKQLQQYLDLKDTQLAALRAQLAESDDKLKLSALQITRANTSVQHLNATVKDLQEENAQLEKKIEAYFKFNSENPITPATPVWNVSPAAPGRLHRGQSIPSRSERGRRASQTEQKEDAEDLLKQQEYLAEFARLRAQREKERLEAERQRRKQEAEDALKEQKAAEIAAAAAERERQLKAKEEAERKKKAEADKKRESAKPKLKSKKSDVPAFLNANSGSNKDTINAYRRKGKKSKRWKSSRSKVQALISGFEQVEDAEDVFDDEPDDDATMMLRMLSTATPTEADPRKWSVDDVVTWLKSIDLGMYDAAFRSAQIDGSILYNDITEVKHLTALSVQELHCNKLLREINILRAEQRNAELEDAEGKGLDDVEEEVLALDPFEMIRELFNTMDRDSKQFIDRDTFDYALEVAGVTTLDKAQTDMVYNQFHFSAEAGITEEEMLLALGKVFVQHHCTDAKMAFRLATVLMLQSTGMISGYADNLEDLFENVAEVQQNLIEWQREEAEETLTIKPFFEEKLMKLMKVAGSRVCVIDQKRVLTIEEFDDMQCARMAGDGVHLSVVKVWWAFSTVHGIQSTYTSLDGKHFTSMRHAGNIVSDENADLHETIILLKHDEFIKYVSVSATSLVHCITIVTTLGKRYECGNNRGDTIIQYKPPASCGVLAFYGSVTHRGLCALGTYVVKNEKTKLKMAFKKGITAAHRRAQLRMVLKGRLTKGVNLEEAIGFVLSKYNELNVRRVCEATDKSFVAEVIEECNTVCKPESIDVIRSQRRKLTSLKLTFSASKHSIAVQPTAD